MSAEFGTIIYFCLSQCQLVELLSVPYLNPLIKALRWQKCRVSILPRGEILSGKNVQAFLVYGVLMKSFKKILKI